MSRMIDRNKRDMQPLEGAGGGASGGLRYKRGEASKRELSGREKLEAASAVGAPAALAGAGALGASVYAGRKADRQARDKAITRTEDMQRSAAKSRMDESTRHYKGTANSTKQK